MFCVGKTLNAVAITPLLQDSSYTISGIAGLCSILVFFAKACKKFEPYIRIELNKIYARNKTKPLSASKKLSGFVQIVVYKTMLFLAILG